MYVFREGQIVLKEKYGSSSTPKERIYVKPPGGMDFLPSTYYLSVIWFQQFCLYFRLFSLKQINRTWSCGMKKSLVKCIVG